MKFEYHHTPDFGEPLSKRLGNYPRVPDLTWDFCRWLGSWLSVLFIRSQFRFKVAGQLPNAERVAIVANHQSHLDTAAILAALPYARRKNTVVLAAEDYFFKSAPRAMAASLLCQGVAFDRLHWTAVRAWYQHLKNLEKGWLLFYPSGSRHSTEIQSGLLKILIREGWTVLPVRLDGADSAWPASASVWRPFQNLKVTFYDPFQGHDLNVLMEKLRRELYPYERQS